MKRFIGIFYMVICLTFAATAENSNGNTENSIIGIYETNHHGEESKVEVSKEKDGYFKAKIIWVKNRLDKNGNVRLDTKNPDKTLRTLPCDQITLMWGLKYDKDAKQWNGGKIYDPTRGIKANASCWFESPSILKVKGSLMGFGETVIWKKIK